MALIFHRDISILCLSEEILIFEPHQHKGGGLFSGHTGTRNQLDFTGACCPQRSSWGMIKSPPWATLQAVTRWEPEMFSGHEHVKYFLQTKPLIPKDLFSGFLAFLHKVLAGLSNQFALNYFANLHMQIEAIQS